MVAFQHFNALLLQEVVEVLILPHLLLEQPVDLEVVVMVVIAPQVEQEILLPQILLKVLLVEQPEMLVVVAVELLLLALTKTLVL
tara:strand:+ start:171 stop:425 length:255 start_codon:yes stop_codon:yes gene_type:complete